MKNPATRKQQAVAGVRWTMLGAVTSQVLNFIVLAILARELGPKAFGVVALAGIWVTFLQYFLSQGLGMAIIQRKDLEPNHLNSAFWLTLGMGVAIASITVTLAPFVSRFFNETELDRVLQVLSVSFILDGLVTVQAAILTREKKFKKLAARSVIGTVAGSIAGITLAYLGYGVWALVTKQLVTSSAIAVVIWAASSWRPSIRFSYSHLKDLWGFSMNVFARNIVSFLYIEIDKLLIGRFIGANQLGFYSNSKQLAQMLAAITRQPVETVTLQLLSELQTDRVRMANSICKVQNMMAVMLMPIFCGLASLAPEVVEIVFGPKWELAKYPLRYLSFSQAVSACSAVSFTALMANGRPALSLLHFAISAAFAVPSILIGTQWGIIGVSIAALVNSFLYTAVFITILCSTTEVSLKRYLLSNFSPAFSCIFMIASVIATTDFLGADSNVYLRAGSGISIGMIVYATLLRLSDKQSFETAKNIALKAINS